MEFFVPCLEEGKCYVELSISFELTGDFLPAALSDDILKTVDYDGLCKYLKEKLEKNQCFWICCTSNLANIIFAFSPLLQGCHLSIVGKRHNDIFESQHFYNNY